MNPTKASNALVATVDFYASSLEVARAELDAKDAVIRQLGEQLKRAETGALRDRTAMDIARDGVIGAALLLVDGRTKGLANLADAVGKLRARSNEEFKKGAGLATEG